MPVFETGSFIEQDVWLSGIWGFPAFRIEENGTFEEKVFRDFCRSLNGRAFFYVKVPLNAKKRLTHYLKNGFDLIDITATFCRALPAEEQALAADRNVVVRRSRREDAAAIRKIASSVFEYDRFHCDPFIDKTTADKVKEGWVTSYLEGHRGEGMIVAEQEGKVTGFLAVLLKPAENGSVLVIDLIGVSADHQRQGIGRTMVKSLIREASVRKKDIEVSTQITNVPSINLYESCGFRFKESKFVLHAHFRQDS